MTPRQSELLAELEGALRAAHDLNEFLWHMVGVDDDAAVQIIIDEGAGKSLPALMNESRDRVARALETLEMIQSTNHTRFDRSA